MLGFIGTVWGRHGSDPQPETPSRPTCASLAASGPSIQEGVVIRPRHGSRALEMEGLYGYGVAANIALASLIWTWPSISTS